MSENLKPSVFVSAICHDGNRNIMMAKRGGQARDRHGEWEFGGGTVEIGETLEGALKRETKEEFGVELSDVQQLHSHLFVRESGSWLGIFYVAKVNPEEVYIAEPVYDEIGWFPLDTLPEPTFEITKELAQKVRGLI